MEQHYFEEVQLAGNSSECFGSDFDVSESLRESLL
jgi:hypothetical protein